MREDFKAPRGRPRPRASLRRSATLFEHYVGRLEPRTVALGAPKSHRLFAGLNGAGGVRRESEFAL